MQSRGVEIPRAEGLSESMSIVVAAGRGDFGAIASMWAMRMEMEVLRLEDAVCLNSESSGPTKKVSFLWGGWEEKDLLFTLTFCPASERPYAVELFTIHSRFFPHPQPHLRPVGVKLADAKWDFLYNKFFRKALLGRLQDEKKKPKPIADPVIILELFDRLLKEDMEYMEAASRSETRT